MQRAARGALIAGELRTIGRGALRLATAPIERMRQVERSRGELASLGMSRADVDAVVRRGRNLSRNIAGTSTAGFTSAAYDVRSGISSLDATGVADITELAALTARATRADLGQMTNLFATGFGQFKGALFEDLSDREFGATFSAQLSKAVEQFKTDGAKMQQAIQSMGSGLAESGVSMALQFASLGALQQKMTAGEAGTTMAALERSAAQAQARFAAAGLGVRTLDEAGNMLAPDQLLQQMQREFGGQYTTQIGAQIQQAFGSEEAVKFFKALWGQGESLKANAAALEEAATQGERYTRAMAARRDDNADARLEKLQQRWDVIQERLGARLIPVLERAIPVLGAGRGRRRCVRRRASRSGVGDHGGGRWDWPAGRRAGPRHHGHPVPGSRNRLAPQAGGAGRRRPRCTRGGSARGDSGRRWAHRPPAARRLDP